MLLALTGLLAVFMPGIIGYGVVCWMMPSKEAVDRLLRAVFIAVLTCGLGFVGGYAFIYVRDPGPYDDGWHVNWAWIWAVVQLAIGTVLGVFSLISKNGEARKAVAKIEPVKDHQEIQS
ncbi:MAG: hypothetical protein QM703_00480 [Gemmatales bacterium]